MIYNLMLKLETNQQTLLRFIAMNEIILFPMVIVMLFRFAVFLSKIKFYIHIFRSLRMFLRIVALIECSGQANLLMPYLYYQFLKARYASRRNTYTRYLNLHSQCNFHSTLTRNPLNTIDCCTQYPCEHMGVQYVLLRALRVQATVLRAARGYRGALGAPAVSRRRAQLPARLGASHLARRARSRAGRRSGRAVIPPPQ